MTATALRKYGKVKSYFRTDIKVNLQNNAPVLSSKKNMTTLHLERSSALHIAVINQDIVTVES
jgi:hypothetical protein